MAFILSRMRQHNRAQYENLRTRRCKACKSPVHYSGHWPIAASAVHKRLVELAPGVNFATCIAGKRAIRLLESAHICAWHHKPAHVQLPCVTSRKMYQHMQQRHIAKVSTPAWAVCCRMPHAADDTQRLELPASTVCAK